MEVERSQVCVETGRRRRDRLVRLDTFPVGLCSDEIVEELRDIAIHAPVSVGRVASEGCRALL